MACPQLMTDQGTANCLQVRKVRHSAIDGKESSSGSERGSTERLARTKLQETPEAPLHLGWTGAEESREKERESKKATKLFAAFRRSEGRES